MNQSPLHQAKAFPASRRGPAVLRGLVFGVPLVLLLLLWASTPSAWSQSPTNSSAAATQAPGKTPASRPANESRPHWLQLTSGQQEVLAPLKAEWPTIDAARKQTWIQLAARMQSLSSDERGRVQQRMSEWVALSPKERGQVRVQFQEARRLAPSGRQEHWEAYQALPQEQRRALAAQAVSATRRAPAVATARSSDPSSPLSSSLKPTAQTPKKSTHSLPNPTAPRLVAPTVVQSRQGATTSLVTAQARPPGFHQAGLPKVNAGEGFVDQSTLLPLRGPQGAAGTPPNLSADPTIPATVDD